LSSRLCDCTFGEDAGVSPIGTCLGLPLASSLHQHNYVYKSIHYTRVKVFSQVFWSTK
jgi:hypothetical protein